MVPLNAHLDPTEENPYAWDFSDGSGLLPSEPYDELGSLSTFLIVNYTLTSIGGGILSFLMVYLVLFRTPGALKKYQKMLLICCVTDLTYWAVDNLMWMKLKEKDGVLIVNMEGLAGLLPRPYRVFIMGFYVWTVCFLNAILPVQLYFRYYSIVRNDSLTTLHTLGLSCLSLIATIPTFIFSYTSFNNSSEERPGFNYGTLWYREFPLPHLLFGDIRSFTQQGFFFYGGALIAISYLISVVIGYRTLQKIRRMNDSYSEKTMRLQKQLTNFMLVQATIPLFVSVVPILMIVVPAFFFLDTDRMCFYCTIAISWIPVLNPIITITVIVPFRRIVCGIVIRKRNTVHTISDSPVPLSTTGDHIMA